MERMRGLPTIETATPLTPRRDVRTFEEFFNRLHPPLFKAAWLMTRDAHEAEEVAQEAFLRVWDRWDRVNGMEDPDGYLYRVAMNVWRSRIRRMKVAIRHALPPSPPVDEIDAVERSDQVVRALRRLPARQRAAVVLVDVVGLDSKSAGDVLRIGASTVRVLASKARARLRKEIDGDG